MTPVEEGKLRAAIRRAELGPEVAAMADALKASVPELLTRCYVGPPNAKGRQAMIILPKETP